MSGPDEKPEIIDVEYEVLEGDAQGPVIDAERVVEDRTDPERTDPKPAETAGAGGALLGDMLGAVLNTPIGKAAAIGLGIYQVGKVFRREQKRKKKRRKKVRRAVKKFRRRL